MKVFILFFVLCASDFITSCEVNSETDFTFDELQAELPERAGQIIIQDAEIIISLPPVTVTSKPAYSLIEDNRIYVSLATYWWPDPNSENGLPYVRDDGNVNPETYSEISDLPRLVEMAKRVELLTDAFEITLNEIYADKALEQLRIWFIDPQTAMYPHLEHAQMVKGLNTGRSYGVIDTWLLIRVVESIQQLKKSGLWTNEVESGLQRWFTHYLNWLRNSEFGQSEMQAKNNHGTWYDLQVVTFARFVGQEDFARDYLINVTKERISGQITRSGRQKHETRRTRPLHYSIFNLHALIKLALHARELDIDLENEKRWFSGSIKDAFLCLITRMDGVDPKNLVKEYDPANTSQLYRELLHIAENYSDNLKTESILCMINPIKLQLNKRFFRQTLHSDTLNSGI
ncbi:MAG: alginate lyase family protein [Balneolaceae bacterium]